MKGGRKNLKRAAEEDKFSLQDGHTIMQVVSLRGSNLIEVGSLFSTSTPSIVLPLNCFSFVSFISFNKSELASTSTQY